MIPFGLATWNSSGGASGVERSLRLRSSTVSMTRTFGTATNQKTWTWSGWVKRTIFGAGIQALFQCGDGSTNNTLLSFSNTTADTLDFIYTSASTTLIHKVTTQLFRDAGGWYHIVLAFDSTPSTPTQLLYVNGVQITSFSTNTMTLTQNSVTNINSNTSHSLLSSPLNGGLDGYATEVIFIDGQALTPSSFGQFDQNGIWVPKGYSGSYGNNGFNLNFRNATSTTTLGNDSSVNANNWTMTSFSLSGTTYDSMNDYPRNSAPGYRPVGNYCTLNPLVAAASGITLGALHSSTTAVQGNIDLHSITGTCYWEVTAGGSNVTAGTISALGLVNSVTVTANHTFGFTVSPAPNQIISYIDITGAGSLTQLATTLDGTAVFPYGTTASADFNFGQRPFVGTSLGNSVCTTNITPPTILQTNSLFDTVLYTGNGAARNISVDGNGVTLNINPDLVWIKSRSAATDHKITDIVRGATKGLISDSTGAETTDANGVTSFNIPGFSLGTDTNYNNNTATYVAWIWKAGGLPVSSSSGSITSQVSVNKTSGISIVNYTGTGVNATVGHELGSTPSLVIVKNRSSGTLPWLVWHKNLTSGSFYVHLNDNIVQAIDNTVWNGLTPTSSVINLGTSVGVNASTNLYVAYCFTPIPNFSSFGSYVGNASADGTFVNTGFRPHWVMVKCITSTGDWWIFDALRPGYNVQGGSLLADSAGAEATTVAMDLLSNGFKLRISTDPNTAQTFIYAAFAEFPFALNCRAR